MRTSQGRNFYCVDKERLTPTCDTNYEKSCKFTLYPGTETPYTYEEFCLPNWEYKPYCELDSKSSKLKTFMSNIINYNWIGMSKKTRGVCAP